MTEGGFMMQIYGVDVDAKGRCVHYHLQVDIVALKCGQCQKYYACYQCHDALEKHPFAAVSKDDSAPVLCGNCRQTLTFDQYQMGQCPFCRHAFNPRCRLHQTIYFK